MFRDKINLRLQKQGVLSNLLCVQACNCDLTIVRQTDSFTRLEHLLKLKLSVLDALVTMSEICGDQDSDLRIMTLKLVCYIQSTIIKYVVMDKYCQGFCTAYNNIFANNK